MHSVLLFLSLVSLLDPVATPCALDETQQGLLYTSGARCGLYILSESGQAGTLSSMPGAGGNALVTDEGILFKECPAGSPQRVVFTTWEGDRQLLLEEDYFSGPFDYSDGTFLLCMPGTVNQYHINGELLRRWPVEGYPSSAVLTGDDLLYTGESGGLERLSIENGETSELAGTEGLVFRRLEPGPEGLVLGEISPCGFMVIAPSGELVTHEKEGLFPSWTEEGNLIFSVLHYNGMVPESGEVKVLDPLDNHCETVLEDCVPLHPLMSGDKVIWTDGLLGTLCGTGAAVRPVFPANGQCGRDPDAHFDVVYMHQRWDTPDWFNGSWSCGPTSCMMATQYYMMLTPDSIWASYPSPGHWSLWGNYIPVEYTFLGFTYDELGESPGGVYVPGAHGFICPTGGAWWDKMVDFLNQHEIFSAWAGTAWSTLTGEIDDQYPVVCSSNVLGYGHIILFNGYYTDHTIVVNDPYGDANEGGWGQYYNGKDVLYDWPGYNNGHVEIGVSQLFYARGMIPSEPDTLVDDCSRGFFKYSDCRYWHITGDGYNGRAWWTYSTGAPPDTCIAEWFPQLPGDGSYDVRVYVPGDHATATGIYKLQTTGGIETVYLDQGLYSNQWVSLGTWDLNGDSYLRLGDYTGTGGEYIAFDAALFSPAVTGTAPHGEAEPVMEMRVWPNPAGETVFLDTSPFQGSIGVEIYDICGRLQVQQTADGSGDCIQLDVSSMSSGIYYMRVISEEGDPLTLSRLLTVCE